MDNTAKSAVSFRTKTRSQIRVEMSVLNIILLAIDDEVHPLTKEDAAKLADVLINFARSL